ncbi:hypothetical protein Aduo_017339 [Ancylostoma duodenale]
MQILTKILAIITTINAISKFERRIPQMEQLATKYYIGDIFQNVEIDIEYPRVLVFKGGYDQQHMKNETRSIVNERLRSMTQKALAKSFRKLSKRDSNNRSKGFGVQQDKEDENHKRIGRSEEQLLDFFKYFFENFDVDFVPEAVYY